jgi:hypothetical protein
MSDEKGQRRHAQPGVHDRILFGGFSFVASEGLARVLRNRLLLEAWDHASLTVILLYKIGTSLFRRLVTSRSNTIYLK